MGDSWQTLLAHTGGRLSDHRVRFEAADELACPEAFTTILPHLAVLHVSGTDAAAFLQSQLTCDIAELSADATTLAAWCNPKGRVLTTLLIQPVHDGFLLLLPATLATSVHRRLGMYVLRSDVKLQLLSEDMPIIGMAGDGVPPDAGYRLTLPGRRLFLSPGNTARDTWDRLLETAPAAGSRCWEQLDIEAGIPWLDEQTSEQFLPQELNLDDTRALSFTKGCYPGQEVIARMRYRGRVKRRLYRLHAEPGNKVVAGETLRDSQANAIGTILVSVPVPDGGETVLAVLAVEAAHDTRAWHENGSSLHIDGEAGPVTAGND